MEFTLNFVWALLAIGMVGLSVRFSPPDTSNRRGQFVALALLLFILLPAISMTDDLLAAQNPAEIVCCLRRDHEYAVPHSDFPAIAILSAPFLGELSFGVQRLTAPGFVSAPAGNPPALASVQNRPPPAA